MCRPCGLALALPAIVGGQPLSTGSTFGSQLGNCPQVPPWPELLGTIGEGAEAFKSGNFPRAKVLLADAADSVTRDEQKAFSCSLGISALYRALAYAYCSHVHEDQRVMRRLNQIGLRFLHLAMNWLTHTFVATNHDQALIDGSAWPIGIQDINNDLTSVYAAIHNSGPSGHAPTEVGREVPHDFRQAHMRIAIVSLCAYPPDHPLPRFSASNQGTYARKHGYSHVLETTLLDSQRPPAWGKIKLMQREVASKKWDWVVWADCDTYFMNMSVTLESVLFTYAGVNAGNGSDASQMSLDPQVHMIVSEDSAMLNTGIFFVRSTEWVQKLFQRVWGTEDSPWINHPWWENAAIAWQFLKDNPRKFAAEDVKEWAAKGEDDLQGVYPEEVRVAPQSHFNSYHPITSRFQHDTWEEGKFVIAFNGVLSASSPTVVRVLYGNYYLKACDLNGLSDCEAVD
mmetsp:Transcript_66199/g.147145  ORF Transcript_66199/g.147145 Transcript_66199/m.147145 type:complete len:455 (-) Transcript_66199:11-1375(-)